MISYQKPYRRFTDTLYRYTLPDTLYRYTLPFYRYTLQETLSKFYRYTLFWRQSDMQKTDSRHFKSDSLHRGDKKNQLGSLRRKKLGKSKSSDFM